MLKRVMAAVVGTRHERERRKIQPVVDAINEHYARLSTASDEELRGQTAKFREIIRERTAGLEARVAELTATLEDPDLYTAADGAKQAALLGAQLEAARGDLESAIARWEAAAEELESSAAD
jgi:preprotein translocase subunit SecA